jgi:hypothetical protein
VDEIDPPAVPAAPGGEAQLFRVAVTQRFGGQHPVYHAGRFYLYDGVTYGEEPELDMAIRNHFKAQGTSRRCGTTTYSTVVAP